VRFKVDENLPVEVAAALVAAGHHADTAIAENLSGAEDPDLLARCTSERRVLVTLDLDFANIRRHPPGRLAGLVVIRLRHQSKPRILALIARLIQAMPHELAGKLCIVDEISIRLHE
jgi:predicted nuclease of predicted toxin-antitoxin system